jgi:hypothetical protein
MASPVRAGSAVGEPSGDLKSIRIEREVLTIDLRALASGAPAVVEAIYKIRNEGETRTVELVFVANAMTADGGGVWLDGQKVSSTNASAEGLPESWKPPQTTPGINGGSPLSYEVKREGTLSFSLELTAGAHTIRVRYQAQATGHARGDSPNVYWQLGYVLAPARQWAGFGGLDTTVLLPTEWKAASDPAMRREGDTLVGNWSELPADALALTIQSPPASQALYTVLRIAVFIVGLCACLALGWFFGGWLGRRQRTSAWALPLALVAALVWGFAFFLGSVIVMNALKERAGSQASWVYGYGDIFISMFYLLLIVPLGLIVTQLAAFIAARRASKLIA